MELLRVDQDTADVIEQEVREYVITKELKKHLLAFLTIIVKLLIIRRMISVFGYLASLVVVNRTF